LNECDGAPWPVQVIRIHIADQAPTETIALVYAKIEVVYNAQ
jgi:type VI protein secretion system component Hcp